MTALTHCPIDGSPIRRNRDGEIVCGGPIVGGHSAAYMRQYYLASIGAEAPSSAENADDTPTPCPTCGGPRHRAGRDRRPYCTQCKRKGGGQHGAQQFSLAGPPRDGYYFDGRTTR